MRVLLDIIAMLSRGTGSVWPLNKSISLNMLAITFGVAFLAFALAVYDGYKNKVERIIFSLTPHIMVRPSLGTGAESETDRSEKEMCEAVCLAPFSVIVREKADPTQARVRFDPKDVAAVEDWLAKNPGGGIDSYSRVLFEEAKVTLSSGKFTSEAERPVRMLGIGILKGTLPAPRVDLTYSDEKVAQRFAAGEGVIISDVLAAEIEKANGSGVEPGETRLTVATGGASHEVGIAGIHRLGIHSISRNLVILPYDLALKLMPGEAEKGPSYIGVSLDDPDQSREVARRIRTEAGEGRLGAVAWQSVSDLFQQLDLYRAIIYVTLSLSILVTAINTFVNMNILIMERGQQIGVMRAMGLAPSKLITAFVGVGLLQSVLGTVAGYAVGVVTGFLLDDYINELVRDFIPITDATIAPDPRVFLAILLFVSVVSVATCLIASRRALRDDIVENLRSL